MRNAIVSLAIGAVIGGICGANHLTASANTAELLPRPQANTYLMEAQADEGEMQVIAEDARFADESIPDEVQQAAEYYGYIYNICPELLEAIAFTESSYKADAVSADGACIGLMQVKASCHKARMERLGVTKEDLLEVMPNMAVAADYLSELFAEHEDAGLVLMIYNGDSRSDAYKETGKMSSYADEILEMSAELERAHKK